MPWMNAPANTLGRFAFVRSEIQMERSVTGTIKRIKRSVSDRKPAKVAA